MLPSAGQNQRLDPYKNYKFRLTLNNRTHSGSILTGLVPPLDPADYRAGNEPVNHPIRIGSTPYPTIPLNRGVIQDPSLANWSRQTSTQPKYPNIPLNQGLTQDLSFNSWANQKPSQGKYPNIPLDRGVTNESSFSSWASLVVNYGLSTGAETSPANFRKDVLLEFYNEAGQLVVSYRVNGVQVSETRPRPPGVYQHFLQPNGPRTMQEQLAAIFENSLRRSAG